MQIPKKLHFKFSWLLMAFLSLNIFIAAQKSEDSAKDDFENYGRNPKFSIAPKKPKPAVKPRKGKTPKAKPTPKPKPNTTVISSVGKPGMKIWLERQVACGKEKPFLPVAPTSVFRSGDCVRARFRLNFAGFLTVINLGTSGENEVIFPSEDQSNEIFPQTDNYLPDNKGWEFYREAGNEELVFIVSSSDVSQTFIDEFLAKRDLLTKDSAGSEIYDRDLKPRTENDSVYVLADDTRLEKPLVFRLTLKHR